MGFERKGTPQIVGDAFIFLMENNVAETVYVSIHNCERPLASLQAASERRVSDRPKRIVFAQHRD